MGLGNSFDRAISRFNEHFNKCLKEEKQIQITEIIKSKRMHFN